ncbi:MAG: GGDEF domain-containing protein [Ancylobacter novellus]|uniref:diguanylate cyclase n=1 Tax=Ancylobacter novellus TaxID=921 RepID=A0A2W5SVG4_ANCNO|nr:MAG: GGDEF domain-containing protein [Ancylobacter novellus]
MLLDYSSLLAAIGFSALCLALVLFSSWLSSRADSFLLTVAIAAMTIVGSVSTYGLYVSRPSHMLASLSFTFLLSGMSILFGAAGQFRVGASPLPRIGLGLLSVPMVIVLILLGYDGIGFILGNAFAAILLFLAALEYWRGRAEAPVAIASMCLIYVLAAVSFACCAAVLLVEGKWVLDAPPDNWAEMFNSIAVVAGLPGVGALALALNQTRLARSHRREAMTDPLTGLLNRRALFDAIAAEPLEGDAAVAVFDIDRFKSINDRHGHATGDRAIMAFAQAMSRYGDSADLAARMGGEEFALVLRYATAESVVARVEAIRRDFAEHMDATHGIACSVSAGIAFVRPYGHHFESTLRAADAMLYHAKRDGRDRAILARVRVVSDQMLTPPSSRPSHP